MTKRIIPKEVKQLGGGRTIPWPANGFNFRAPDGPPKGLRLSEPCGACCILDYFLERPGVVSEGVSTAGHMYADMFIQGFLEPECPVEVEKVYQWAPIGFSGMDCIVEPSGTTGTMGGRLKDTQRNSALRNKLAGHYEYKTTSKELNPKPSKANREQVIRQRVVMARYYKITDDELFNSYIFIISKSGYNTGKSYGPFLVEPTKEELNAVSRDVDLRIQIYEDLIEDGLEADPYQHPLLKELRKGSCTRCFPLEKAEPNPEINTVLSRGRKDWDDWITQQKLDKWIKDTKEKVKPLVPIGQSMETEYFLIRHTESGRLYIDPKNLTT